MSVYINKIYNVCSFLYFPPAHRETPAWGFLGQTINM